MKKRYVIQASCFDRKGNLLSTAVNDYNKSSPFMAKFAKLAGEPEKVYWHAEALAIYRALKKKQKIDTVIVLRYDSLGHMKNARPCKVCEYVCKFFGVQKVLYSTEQGMLQLNLE